MMTKKNYLSPTSKVAGRLSGWRDKVTSAVRFFAWNTGAYEDVGKMMTGDKSPSYFLTVLQWKLTQRLQRIEWEEVEA